MEKEVISSLQEAETGNDSNLVSENEVKIEEEPEPSKIINVTEESIHSVELATDVVGK